MSARLALLTSVLLAGCSFVVGDIELPDDTLADAARDGAATDAAKVDANRGDAALLDALVPDAARPDAVVADAANLDAVAPDAFAPDAAMADAAPADAGPTPDQGPPPDAGPPPPPPPLDVAELAGDWHLYGYSVGANGVPTVFTVVLTYLDGRASLRGFDGSIVRRQTPFMQDLERPDRLSTNLFPFVGVLTGRFDAPSGLGILVNDVRSANERPTFVLAVKAPVRRENLDDAFYGRIGTGDAADGQIGNFQQAGSGYALTNRYAVGVDQVLGDAVLTPSDESAGRVRLTDFSLEDMIGTIAPGGAGYVALTQSGEVATGLSASWRSHAGEVAVRPGRFWCAGLTRDAAGGLAPIAVYGDLDAGGRFVWDDGRASTLEVAGNAYLMHGANGLFGAEGGLALVDRRGRVYVSLPMRIDDAGERVVGWGLAACVPVDGDALPEVAPN
jgi:hypothetical protein